MTDPDSKRQQPRDHYQDINGNLDQHVVRLLTCISHHPTAEARGKKAVIRVSCLVIRENHGRRTGSLQKECLTAGEPERPCLVTRDS